MNSSCCIAGPPFRRWTACPQVLGGAALMSASAESESRSTAKSPMETMPTGLPFSTTGRRRRACSRMSVTASVTSALGESVTRSRLQMSPSLVSVGWRPSASARTTMSRSVTMPHTSLPSVTITSPMFWSRICRAASLMVAVAGHVSGFGVMRSFRVCATDASSREVDARVLPSDRDAGTLHDHPEVEAGWQGAEGPTGVAVTDEERPLEGEGHRLHHPPGARLDVGRIGQLLLDTAHGVVEAGVGARRRLHLGEIGVHRLGAAGHRPQHVEADDIAAALP